MAFGTLAFDTLQTSDSKNTGTSKTLDTSYVFNGTSRHYLHLNGSDHSVLDSFNNSSTTDDGTGLVTLTVTSSFTDANYAYTASRNGSTNNTFAFTIETPSRTSTTMSVSTKLSGASTVSMGDANSFSCSIFGDLA